MSLRSKPLTEFPFAAGNLKLGFEVNSRWESNREYLLALLKGRSSLFQLASQYLASWSKTSNPTVLHYRDYLLGKGLFECLVNCQYRDSAKTTLTRHSTKAWAAYSYDDIWPYRSPSPQHPPDYKYADVLGSLGYYATQLDPNVTPTELLSSLVGIVWQNLGFVGNPTDRLTQLYSALDLSGPLSVIPAALTVINQATSGIALTQLYQLRREQLVPQTDQLALRVFLGEYDDSVFHLCFPLLTDASKDSITKVLSNCLSLTKPSGGLLILQALAVEGYLKAVELLNAQPETVLRLPLDTFYASTVYSDIKYELASNLALSYDAYSIQSTWDSILTASQSARNAKQLALYWLSGSARDSIPAISDTRINVVGWYQAEDLRLTEIAETADPQFLSLQQQPPKGTTRLLKADKQFGNRISLQVTDVLGNPVEGKVFPLYGPDATGTLTPTGGIGSYSVTLSSTNPVAFVATDPEGSVVDLDTYLAVEEPYSTEQSYSNVVPVFPQPTDTSTSAIETGFQDVLSTYDLLFGLQSTSNPRGSNNDLYLANGLPEPGLQDYQMQLRAMRDDIYGYRQESSARTLGLVSLLDSVHLNSAIKSALDWLPSKPPAEAAADKPTTTTENGVDTSTLMSGGSLTSSSEGIA